LGNKEAQGTGPSNNAMSKQSAMRSDDKSRDDLHGNAPDCSQVVLLLVDVINDLDFPKNERLVRESRRLSARIARLKERCKGAGIPAIYVNDNFGKWRSEFSEVVRHCLRADAPGRSMVEAVLPEPQDYIVLKPKHSAFYATPLDTLLEYIGVKNVILSGITTNACVMITAGDIYVRDLGLFVPSDCVAALTEEDQIKALELMKANFGADTTPAERLDLKVLSRAEPRVACHEKSRVA
jgi:nicotinamidase-related amidase